MRQEKVVLFFSLFFGLSSALLYPQSLTVTKVGEWGQCQYDDIVLEGNYAYCAADTTGLDIIDISSPDNPIKAGNYNTPGAAYVVFVSGSYAYIADGISGLQIINVSNPASPTLAGSFNTSGIAYGVFVSGSYAYVADANAGLQIINVFDPASPTLAGSCGTTGDAYGVFVSGSYAYVAAGSGLEIINVSDPASPTLAGSCGSSGLHFDVFISGNYAYLVDREIGLEIIDITDPASPTPAGSYNTSGQAFGVHVEGSYAYVADGSNGMLIIDITEPASPALIGSYNTSGTDYAVFVDGGYAYTADGIGGLQIIDITDPGSPVLASFFDMSGWANGVHVAGSYSYVAAGPNGLKIINISNPASPTLAGSYAAATDAEDIFVNGTYAYVANGSSGVRIINVSNPASPTLAGSYATSGSALRVFISGDYAYVAEGSDGLEIINVSNPASPTLAGSYATTGDAEDVFVSGDYAYVGITFGGLRIIDVSNPASPTLVGSYTVTSESGYHVYVSGGYAYLAVSGSGLEVIDVSNPASPSLVGSLATASANGIFVSGGYAHVAEGEGGLAVVDISNPVSPSLAGFYVTPGVAQDLYRTEEYVYIADGDSGKLIILQVGGVPTVTTTTVTDITQTTAQSGGNVTGEGVAAVTARGVCWSTAENPTTADSKTDDGLGMGSYESSLTGLTSNTTYHVRAYAKNTMGTAYGNDIQFTTLSGSILPPTVTTTAVTDITQTTAQSGGNVTSDGGAAVTARGVCWSTAENPTTADAKTEDGSGTGTYVSELSELSPNTTYHVRAYATNSVGTAYGNDRAFATPQNEGWIPAKNLTSTSGISEHPAIAVNSSGHLNVVWHDNTSGNYEIYYKKSINEGDTWTANRRLTWTSGNSLDPAIAVDSWGHLHVAWQDDTSGNAEIYYKKSTDAGTTWTAGKRLTSNSGASDYPIIAVNSSGHIHLFWVDNTPGNHEIYYAKSTDEGSTWTANRRLTWTSGISEHAAAVVNSIGHLNLVWHDNTTGGYEVYYRKSTDEGSTWTASRRLTWTSGVSECPAIAADSSDFLHMFWEDNTAGNFEIYYRKSTDGGVTWTANQRLTWNSGNSLNPAIAVDSSDFLHMFWEDDTPGNFEIYYRKSLNGGAAWTANQRLTWNSGNSLNPAIAVDASGNLHVVWEDATAGNLEIYYKRGK